MDQLEKFLITTHNNLARYSELNIMTPCTPAPPCDLEYPLFCEPRELTAIAKRLVVEDSSACDRTLQTPPSGQVLISNANGTISWTNGANDTLLRKTSTGSVEFATLNNILQANPVNLGSQPLTTTGVVSVGSLASIGAITATSVTATGIVTAVSVSLGANPTTNLQATTKQYVDAADALKLNKAGDTMTGALIVNSTIASNNTILANGNSSKIGYDTGAGGSVTQGAGAKTNSVTLNRPTGIIVTDSAALATDTAVTFNLSNSVIEATDIVVVSHISGGTLGSYNFATAPATGNANIVIRNITATSLSEALTLRFIVIKSVNA
jgi:hypothetical protein